jgi:hypothetical protein
MPASREAFIAAASSFAGLSDTAGLIPLSFAESIRRQAGGHPLGRWDTALIYHWGYWSQFDHTCGRTRWPLPQTAMPQVLGEFGIDRGLLYTDPEEGDVFLQWSPRRAAFVRGGVVVQTQRERPESAMYWDVVVVEGNSGACGELGGRSTHRIARRLSAMQGDRFLRWSRAERRFA